MNITVTEQDTICILELNGRMDATTVSTFENVCKENLDKNFSKILVDMSALEYISSAGLRGILLMEKTSKAKQIPLVFYGLQSMVYEVFKISSFLSILKICTTKEEALSL